MGKNYIAHITTVNGMRVDQSVNEHSRRVAKYVSEYLKGVNLYYAGYLIGLLHDCGKAKNEMTTYLEDAFYGKEPVKGSVNHTFAAVKFIMSRYYSEAKTSYEKIACEILAIAMGSHHGLFDMENPFGSGKENGLLHRVECSEEEIGYGEAMENFFCEVADVGEIDELYSKAIAELCKFISKIETYASEYKKNGMYLSFSYITRLMASALIEGDRRDTAEFMNNRGTSLFKADKPFWNRQLYHMEERLKNFNKDTILNKARADISQQCRKFAERKGGIYRLTVQTGGGKTLSSLRYSLAHAAKYGKERIIFIIPLLSVLDQNSKDLREYIKDPQYIFEDHSNIIRYSNDKEELDKLELLEETWDSPIIISTLVQLLNILFSHKTSSIRKMKSLCNSIIVIDEVQSLPLKFTHLFTMAMNFLSEHCGATVVLCSATQPAFEKVKWPIHFGEKADMVELSPEFSEAFKRVNIKNEITAYGKTIEELADFALKTIEKTDSLLIICNTKSTAKQLYKMLILTKKEDYEIYHLSTSMCKKHREIVLNKIGKTPGLDEDRKVICVSTQLVEAGIDFSFQSVIRVWAGVDNIAQAAGRCNRNNDWKTLCNAYIVNLQGEKLGPLESIKQAQKCCQEVIYDNNLYENQDMLSKDFIRKYFERLYESDYSKKEFKFPVDIRGREFYVRNMLSTNQYGEPKAPYIMRQAFKTAGENCKVFDDEKTDVIVNFDDNSEEFIANITSEKGQNDYSYVKAQLAKLKPYTVGLFPYELDILRRDCKLDESGFEGIIFLDKSAYDSELGVCPGEYHFADDIAIV